MWSSVNSLFIIYLIFIINLICWPNERQKEALPYIPDQSDASLTCVSIVGDDGLDGDEIEVVELELIQYGVGSSDVLQIERGLISQPARRELRRPV